MLLLFLTWCSRVGNRRGNSHFSTDSDCDKLSIAVVLIELLPCTVQSSSPAMACLRQACDCTLTRTLFRTPQRSLVAPVLAK